MSLYKEIETKIPYPLLFSVINIRTPFYSSVVDALTMTDMAVNNRQVSFYRKNSVTFVTSRDADPKLFFQS